MGLKARIKFAKCACVVTGGGLGVKSMGFLDREDEPKLSETGDAGPRICGAFMELREMAGWGAAEDSASLLSLKVERVVEVVEVEEAVVILSRAGETGRSADGLRDEERR